MFTRLKVESFKGIDKLDISLSRVTIIVGENGTGKSTLLQAISIVKQSKGGVGIQTNLPFANLGLLPSLIPGARTALIEIEGQSVLPKGPIKSSEASFACSLSFDANGFSSQRTRFSIEGGESIEQEWARYGLNRITPDHLVFGNARFAVIPSNGISILFGMGGFQLQSATPDLQKQAQETFQQLSLFSALLATALDRFQVLAPMRGITEPAFQLPPQPVTEYTPRQGTQQSGASLAANLVYNSKSTQRVSEWEKEILGVGVRTELLPGPTVTIQNPEVGSNFVNEGFGANQLLFVLERLANLPVDSTLAIEEPEIHLHPKAQFNFGKCIARLSVELKKQVIVTTHSPDLISGVVAAVRQKLIPANEVAIWFLERGAQGVVASRSDVSAGGTISGKALSSFVDASMRQVTEYFTGT